ncbi:hypothetical protein ACFSR7_24975 [Cohnella sp. GCM10020058]|uniref:hypothetical protein n=1 Tax=Cohnella sp. GCM10020058 TaxID=3317330 RepID=UPI003630CB60
MRLWTKVLWWSSSLFGLFSFIWFLLGETAGFQRSMDLVATVNLVYLGIPCLVISVLFLFLLLKSWTPISGLTRAGVLIGMILLLALSVLLLRNVHTEGWLSEKVTSDSIKVTADGKYEYRLELINLFQRNSKARLYVRRVSDGEITTIPVDVQTDRIVVLGVKKVNNWAILENTDTLDHYDLVTTEELQRSEEKFEIDIVAGTSKKLE